MLERLERGYPLDWRDLDRMADRVVQSICENYGQEGQKDFNNEGGIHWDTLRPVLQDLEYLELFERGELRGGEPFRFMVDMKAQCFFTSKRPKISLGSVSEKYDHYRKRYMAEGMGMRSEHIGNLGEFMGTTVAKDPDEGMQLTSENLEKAMADIRESMAKHKITVMGMPRGSGKTAFMEQNRFKPTFKPIWIDEIESEMRLGEEDMQFSKGVENKLFIFGRDAEDLDEDDAMMMIRAARSEIETLLDMQMSKRIKKKIKRIEKGIDKLVELLDNLDDDDEEDSSD